MVIQTVAGGDFYTAADFILDGGDASSTTGYGGLAFSTHGMEKVLQALPGDGPGGPKALSSGEGNRCYINYNANGEKVWFPEAVVPVAAPSRVQEQEEVPSGSMQMVISILASGALLSASGGKGRSNEDPELPGGGGSGGAIHIYAANIYNQGMIRVLGANQGAGDGQVLFASPGTIEKGVLDTGNGKLITITPPVIEKQDTEFLSFEQSKEKKSRILVKTRPQNLKLHWPMEEVTGFTLEGFCRKCSRNLAGRTTRVDGKIGQAIEFDGLSGYAWTEAYRRRNRNYRQEFPYDFFLDLVKCFSTQ